MLGAVPCISFSRDEFRFVIVVLMSHLCLDYHDNRSLHLCSRVLRAGLADADEGSVSEDLGPCTPGVLNETRLACFLCCQGDQVMMMNRCSQPSIVSLAVIVPLF